MGEARPWSPGTVLCPLSHSKAFMWGEKKALRGSHGGPVVKLCSSSPEGMGPIPGPTTTHMTRTAPCPPPQNQ